MSALKSALRSRYVFTCALSLNTEMSAGRDREIMLENTVVKTPFLVISPTVPLVIG
jgi:hypothetical protein